MSTFAVAEAMKHHEVGRPLTWFLQSYCHRYKLDRINTPSGPKFVAWATGRGDAVRVGEFTDLEVAKKACEDHRAKHFKPTARRHENGDGV